MPFSQKTSIENITIDNLYGSVNLDISLRPALNIVYGRNGRGKTGLLHVLANIFELDFERFMEIRFRTISIRTIKGDRLSLQKHDNSLRIEVKTPNAKQHHFTLSPKSRDLPAEELASVAAVVYGTAIYFPAFRSILERTLSHDTVNDARPPRRHPAAMPTHQNARRKELERLAEHRKRDSSSFANFLHYQNAEKRVDSVLSKTDQCRRWFGPFVPLIRYLSIDEVDEYMATEWQAAYMDATVQETRTYERICINTVKLLSRHSSDHREAVALDSASLWHEIKSKATRLSQYHPQGGLQDFIRQLSETLDTSLTEHVSDNVSRALRLYRDEFKSLEREFAKDFLRCEDFVASVNLFLEGKKIDFVEELVGAGFRRLKVTGGTPTTTALNTLSSGERHILTMLATAAAAQDALGPLLIDEPELSLHIDWQRLILKELMKQVPERQIIACTHSPEIGADYRDAVQILN